MNARIRQAVVLSLSILLLSTIIPSNASAFPYVIEGYLKDSNGVPITLAEIKLTGIYYNMTIQDFREADMTTQTDSHGYYRVTPEVGSTGFVSDLVISYESGDDVVSKPVPVDETAKGVWVNLTYDKGSDIGDILSSPVVFTAIIVATISVIFIIFYVIRSNKDNDEQDDHGTRNVGRRRR